MPCMSFMAATEGSSVIYVGEICSDASLDTIRFPLIPKWYIFNRLASSQTDCNVVLRYHPKAASDTIMHNWRVFPSTDISIMNKLTSYSYGVEMCKVCEQMKKLSMLFWYMMYQNVMFASSMSIGMILSWFVWSVWNKCRHCVPTDRPTSPALRFPGMLCRSHRQATGYASETEKNSKQDHWKYIRYTDISFETFLKRVYPSSLTAQCWKCLDIEPGPSILLHTLPQ